MVIHWIAGIPCFLYDTVTFSFFKPQRLELLCEVYIRGDCFCEGIVVAGTAFAGIATAGFPTVEHMVIHPVMVHMREILNATNHPCK
jgi:hypothetical protein